MSNASPSFQTTAFTASARSLLGRPEVGDSPRPDKTGTGDKNGTPERTIRSGSKYRDEILVGEGGWSIKLSRRGVTKMRRVGMLAALVALWFVIARILHLTKKPTVPCNAFRAPGRLVLNLTSPLHTVWMPFDHKRCAPLPPYLPALWRLTHGDARRYLSFPKSFFPPEYAVMGSDPLPSPLFNLAFPPTTKKADPIAFLRKKRHDHPPTVLVLGDSVDRNGLTHFCQLFKRNVTISHYHDIRKHPPGPQPPDLTKGHGPKFDGWDQRGLMHKCDIPFAESSGTVAMRVINGFHYGMDDLDEFNTPDHNDWHPPGKIERRIDQLVMPAVEQLGGADKIDVVQLHSGMWDLALFGSQDDKHRFSLTTPLTPEQLAWWQERMLHTIYHVRQRFPKARLVFRKQHRTDDIVDGTQYITNLYAMKRPVCQSGDVVAVH
ncbi:uncharacterized protein JCM15063_000641 [Sporobolomyces koalae]|uniref:uncharacterized protein n=1 Tax=Sporobolomyces koalae TaxID=500713 RepID=UPI00316C39F5